MSQSDLWGHYARLQSQANCRKLDAKAWTADEQADAFLDAIANNAVKPTPHALETWEKNLATNRAKKHRRRKALLHAYQHGRSESQPSKTHYQAVVNETIERVRKITTRDEWSALYALAGGEDYRSVAAAQGCSETALKTRISRCRKRLLAICA